MAPRGARRPAADKDGYPTVCCLCGQRIVKAHPGAIQFHFDHTTREAKTWHVRCGSPLLEQKR